MNKLFLTILMCGFIGNGCSRVDKETQKLVETNAITIQIVSAGDFLKGMKHQGRLPGISKDEHGKITSEALPFSDQTEFPILITFHLTKDGSPLPYHYSLARPSDNAGWQLKRAWRTDIEGHIVEGFFAVFDGIGLGRLRGHDT